MVSSDSTVDHPHPSSCVFFFCDYMVRICVNIKNIVLFLGTAGVWRISALNEAGGWKDRTIVEDMDLAVRAYLSGWKFVFVDDVKVKNELPSSFGAYRFQQHRWSCGPANLFKKMAMEIIQNQVNKVT